MSKEIEVTQDDGTVVKEIVFTKEEVDAQLKEKDDHLKTKLDEFQQGKTAAQLAEEARKVEIAAANKKAEDAMATVTDIQTKSRGKVIDYLATQFVGEDPELRKKLDEGFKIIEDGFKAQGKDISDDKVIQEIMTKAASMSGITAPASPVFPMNGGMAPSFQKKEGELSDTEHNTFLEAVGYKPDAPAKKD